MQKTMTKEQLAEKLNGVEYRDIPEDLENAARENNLVIISGCSDDIIRYTGAIDDEDYPSFGSALLPRDGMIESDCNEGEECPYFQKWLDSALESGEVQEIKVYWCGKCHDVKMDATDYEALGKPTWCYEGFGGRFATFDMFDTNGDEKEYYCRGLVIDLDEIWPENEVKS